MKYGKLGRSDLDVSVICLGTMTWGEQNTEADAHAQMASVQNPYNLPNRTYEVGLAEMSIREQCGLLAYSPSAMGILSGNA